jgi:hypothetical protein
LCTVPVNRNGAQRHRRRVRGDDRGQREQHADGDGAAVGPARRPAFAAHPRHAAQGRSRVGGRVFFRCQADLYGGRGRTDARAQAVELLGRQPNRRIGTALPRSSPGIPSATSAGLAPQWRCQPRSRGAVRNRGTSATTSRTCRARSAGVGGRGAHRSGSLVAGVGGPLVGSVRVGIIGAPPDVGADCISALAP